MAEFCFPEVKQCGYYTSENDLEHEDDGRVTELYEIEYIVGDGHSVFIDGREIPLRKDTVLVIKPGCTRVDILPFRTIFIKLSAGGEIAALLESLPDSMEILHTEKIQELLHKIILHAPYSSLWKFEDDTDRKKENRFACTGNLLLLLDLLRQDAARQEKGLSRVYPRMHRVKTLIESRYAEKLTVAALAREIGLSESRLRALFREIYGISPHRYLTEVRIRAACRMLTESNCEMSMVAERCGFGGQQYFSDTFRKETGTTPGRYRTEAAKKYTGIV